MATRRSRNDLAREGLDIERLNTVILATSQKDVNQSVGRAMRKLLSNGDLRPLIIDFADNLSSFKNHARLRKRFYMECKYKIEEYNIYNDEITKDDSDKEDVKIGLNTCLETEPVEFILENNDKKENNNINNDDGTVDGTEDDSDLSIEEEKPKKTNKTNKISKFKKRII
jgi:hypothetical protein